MFPRKIWKAAISQIDITPDYPTTLVGRYRPEPSKGVLHRLFAQVLFFQSDSKLFCLIAVDSLGLMVPLASRIRSQIAAKWRMDISHVMSQFSHTHSAPNPTADGRNGERYYAFLLQQIERCAEEAYQHFRPCKIGWALTSVDIGENRRKDGTALDKRLGALLVADAETEQPIGMIVRIAAHANILPSENRCVSSDFIGAAREELQHLFRFPVMFIQGAAGNIKAAGTNGIGEGSGRVLQRVAGELVDGVKRLRFSPQEVIDIQMLSTQITCTADVPTEEEALQAVGDSRAPAVVSWLKACSALRKAGIYVQRIPMEMQFLKLNEGGFCGVSAEIFCELALEAQERLGSPLFFLNGYTNGYDGYLPSREEWYKGGYEVVDSYLSNFIYLGHVAAYRPETASQIVDVAVSRWNKLLAGI